MINKSILPTILFLFLSLCASTQEPVHLNYYLPETKYDPSIPTPEDWLGFQVGAWHCSHDQLLGYIKQLAKSSNRAIWQEYGKSHEQRTLGCLIISHPDNLAQLDRIKAQRLALTDPKQSDRVDLKNAPAVCYMGYSIHGNETSGANAALLVAYYLLAAQNSAIDSALRNTVFLLDPCFNPDGMQRFSTWVNSHKSQSPSADPIGEEYNEPWPRSRTNHYGFDLNRDWLVARQPETKGRLALLQVWRPNVLTDHHEMGSNATFFFQPGVPARVNPITPDLNQELTAKITRYHAQLLSSKGIPFYSGENFDDFYYGKGSTYPDARGGIGILFEQGSSRGTAQETDNGLLSFPYTIRNQVLASLATIQAVNGLRLELNTYLKTFHKSALKEAAQQNCRGYVFEDGTDEARDFLQLLFSHSIEVGRLKRDVNLNGYNYKAASSFFVPCDQAQYRIVRAIFERPTSFKDSIFYDISAWTLPDAFGLQWAEVPSASFKQGDYSNQIAITSLHPPTLLGDVNLPYAFAISPEGDRFPEWVAALLQKGIRVKIAMEPFELDGGKYPQGTAIILTERQLLLPEALLVNMNEILQKEANLSIINQGASASGPDLGSSKFQTLRNPKALLLGGEGVSVAEFGEIWHLLDTRYHIPVTVMDANRTNGVNWSNFNVLILPDGNFGGLNSERVKQFVTEGGTVIATGKALQWLKSTGLAAVEFKKTSFTELKNHNYQTMEEDKSARALPGAILEAELDLTHPLCFGYKKSKIPVFLGDSTFVIPGKNIYSCPVKFSRKPLMAGYIHPDEMKILAGLAGVMVYGLGKGKIIGFAINPNFRAFWYGTNRLFANALLFGNTISPESTERK